jgi:hemolysin-activating ACP:hemolysin acyltransferase
MFFSSRKKATAEPASNTTSPTATPVGSPDTLAAAAPEAVVAPALQPAAVSVNAPAQPVGAPAIPGPIPGPVPTPASTAGSTGASAANGASAPQPASLGPQQAQAAASRTKNDYAIFGEIVSIYMRSADFKQMTLAQIERLVVPAVASRQFLVAEAQSKSTGKRAPVAVVLWASVSADIDKRLSDGSLTLSDLETKDWKSGDIPWLAGAAGNVELLGRMLKQVQTETLKGRNLKYHSPASERPRNATAVAAE